MSLDAVSASHLLDGWKNYPTNLSYGIEQDTNLEYLDRQLKEDSKKLFSEGALDIRIETVTCGTGTENLAQDANAGTRTGETHVYQDTVTDVDMFEGTLIVGITQKGP